MRGGNGYRDAHDIMSVVVVVAAVAVVVAVLSTPHLIFP